MKSPFPLLSSLLAAAGWLLAGCAAPPPRTPPADTAPLQWSATVPHGGQAAKLAEWWGQFDDPTLLALIQAAQAQNPSLAQATARIVQARAATQGASAARWPSLNGNASAARSSSDAPPLPGIITSGSATLDASWEIDLFGATRNKVLAAEERALGSEAQWHAARVSLAAEVAETYVGLRSCEAVLDVYAQDARSSSQTAGLTQQKVGAGLDAPANAALARAAAADAANRVLAERAECDVAVKGLVALTVQAEPALRQSLAARRARLPQPAAFGAESVPAQLLSQRPDIAVAERNIAAASADVGAAQADRYPRLSLNGSIGRSAERFDGETFAGNTWSIGAGLLAPIFDAGRRRAAVDAAQGRYDEAVASYRASVLTAVREVEEALVRLDAAGQREADARLAAGGYAEFMAAAETQWKVGTGSLLDLEQARRNALAAEAGLIQVQRERVSAWLSLYKALGGGWSRDDGVAAGDVSSR